MSINGSLFNPFGRMSIRTKLRLNAVITIGLALVVALTVFVSSRNMEEAARNDTFASRVIKDVSDLTSLSYAYLLLKDERPQMQWELKYASLGKVLSEHAVGSREQEVILARLRSNHEQMKQLFDVLSERDEKSPTSVGSTSSTYDELNEGITAQLLARAEVMTNDASLLGREAERYVGAVRRTSLILIVVSALILMVSATITASLLAKSIGGSIGVLEQGTQRIASGDLGYRVAITGNDEISRLTTAFNNMTANLETSRGRLEAEMAERRRAQEALQRAHDELEQRVVERTEALRESEQRWATTLASIGDAVIATDVTGRITFMNAVAEALTGWTLRDASQRPVTQVFNIINEQTRGEVENPVTKVLREGMIVGLANHTILVRKDGTEAPIDDSGAPIRDADGKTMGVVLVFRSITERRQAERALRQSERRLAEIVERSPSFVCILRGPDHVFELANEQYFQLVGRRDILGKKLLEALPELVATPYPEILDRVYRTGEAFTATDVSLMLARRSDGQLEEAWLDFIYLPLREEDGSISGIFVHGVDLTQRKRAEESLRESEKRMGRAQEIAHLGSWELDVVNNRLSWSDEVYRIFGLRPQEFGATYDAFLEAVHPDDRAAVDAAYSGSLREGRDSYEIEHRVIRKSNDEVRTVHERCEHIRDEAGRIIRSVGMVHDITERKRAEEALKKAHNELEKRVEERTVELQQAYDRLKKETREREQVESQLRQAQKMEAVGTLAGGIAHDFNNILAAMIGFSELAADEIPADSKAQRHLKRVHAAGLRARELVKQILTFSRKSEGQRQQISLASLVHETYALLRSSLPTTIQMPLAITTGDDHVLADPTQLQQVLMNLATNAAHAMRDDGGQLTIGVSSVTFPRGSPLPDPDMEPGAYVKLTVKDTGTGMTEEVRQRIFEPFFTTKEVGKGTGMGLAVVYGLVKSHEGAITVQSEVGQGSTFEVFLPRAQKPEVKKEEETTFALPTGTERILFVDDEEMLVEMTRNMLESLGYRVTVAKDPTEAWNLFLENPSQFDLVITDQTMPDVTGVTLAQKMLRVRKEMPIILCTGYSEMVSADKAKEVGICEFVMKPMVKKELAGTIRKVLEGRKK